MLVYCVRHGESAYNAEGRIQGQSDVPLSELGRKQSQAVATAFDSLGIQAIYASPLRRASETAEPLAARLGLSIAHDPNLMELNAGIFQGMLWSEITSHYPEEATRWLAHDPEYRIPGGESPVQLMARGKAAFEAMAASGHDRVVAVSHGGLLGAAFKALLSIPANRNPFMLYNGSISVVNMGAEFKLVSVNQIEHLRLAGDELKTRAGDL